MRPALDSRTKWTRRVPRPVLSGHAASLVQLGGLGDAVRALLASRDTAGGARAALVGLDAEWIPRAFLSDAHPEQRVRPPSRPPPY